MAVHAPAIRRAALALLLILLTGLLPVAAPAGPAVAQSASDVPREEREVEIKRGDRTLKMRPIKKVTLRDGREAVADRLVVGFRPGVAAAERAAVHRAAGAGGAMRARVVAAVGPDAQVVDVAGAASLERAAQVYAADPRVAYAEPDYVVRAAGTPNDPRFGEQWGMSKINAPLAWNVTRGSTSRVVAVLDCGIYDNTSSTFVSPITGIIGHPDINGKVVGRRDFTGSATGADDYCNHGTHVAGIAAANTNNGVGVAGVGYDTRLLNIKVLDDSGSGTNSWVASGIRWAADNGAHVINLSLSGPGACPSLLRSAINYAYARNVVVVAAAGNDGSSISVSPANCPNTLAVASTTSSDALSYFSNYGASWVDVAAPGSAILSTDYAGDYEYFDGTSMAAPHVAGLAALLWATGHYSTAQAVINRITGTADRITGTGAYWQYGRINAYAAVAGLPAAVTVDGGHNVLGATAVTTVWYFAEGYTAPGFDEYLTILNPSATTDAQVTITYFLADGTTQTKNFTVNRTTRSTVAVHGTSQGVGRGLAVAAKVESTNGAGIVVERPMYFRYSSSVNGGHNVMGAAAPQSAWYFAEGYTGTGFDEYLTIQNPNGSSGTATITYYLEGGGTETRTVALAANSRTTVAVHASFDAGSNPGGLGRGKAHATRVTTDLAGGIVVERPMYFTYTGSVSVNGGHNVMGAAAPQSAWYFAEGYTGTGFDEYLTIQNPNGSDGQANITYYVEGQNTPTTCSVALAANSRTTVVVHAEASSGNPCGLGRGKSHAIKVTTDLAGGIVVERPMYFRYSSSVNGGHNVMGAAAPQSAWYFAEGYTGTGFDEYLTIQNPNGSSGTATITYYLEGGGTETRTVALAANSRTTVAVHASFDAGSNPGGLGRGKAHATRVTTDLAGGIVVERPMYFTYTLSNS